MSESPDAATSEVRIRNHRSRHLPNSKNLAHLWEFCKEDTNIFKEVEIDRDAGFDELEMLANPGRYLSAFIAVAFVLANIFYIVCLNAWTLWNHFIARRAMRPWQPWLMIRHWLKICFGVKLDSEAAIAGLELVLGLGIIVYIAKETKKVLLPRNETRKWMAVSKIFFVALPTATNVSALKLLNYVTPQVIMADAWELIEKVMNEGFWAHSYKVMWFIASRFLAAMAGFDTFLFKFQTLAFDLHGIGGSKRVKGQPSALLILSSLVFLNQMLGVVQVGMFTFRRVFIFVFGGENGSLSTEEERRKRIWEAMFVRELWRVADVAWYDALAICLSFSDADLQKLVIDTPKKQQRRGKALAAI